VGGVAAAQRAKISQQHERAVEFIQAELFRFGHGPQNLCTRQSRTVQSVDQRLPESIDGGNVATTFAPTELGRVEVDVRVTSSQVGQLSSERGAVPFGSVPLARKGA